MSLQINYIDAPDGAQENMTVAAGNGNKISDVSLIPPGARDTPYATLEPGVWVLDGTREIMPDTPTVAWWSNELSGDDGKFTSPPRLEFRFPYPYTATGLTFTFSPSTNQWCSEIRVSWYNGQTLLAEGAYYPESANWVLEQTVESFDLFVVELVSTNRPQNFAKVQRIEVGKTILFSEDEITDVRLLNEMDPYLCELTADTVTFGICDAKSRNLLPQENQKVEIRRDGKTIAVHYINNSVREAGNRYSISGQSAIGLLTDDFLGGMYTDKPLEELLKEVLEEWPYDIHKSFSGISVSGYIPVCTRREALQQIVFAIGAVVTTQGDGIIKLNPMPETVTSVFPPADVFLGGKVTTAPRFAKVEVYAHSYAPSDESEVLVQNEQIDGVDVLLTFTDPHHSYEITGGTITSSGANWVKVTAAGPVEITAKKYIHSTVLHAKRNPLAVAREQGNVLTVAEATLVNSENVLGVVSRLYEASKHRSTAKQEVIVGSHKAGDRVASVNPWGTQIRGFITSMDSTLTQNGHTAMVEILGVEVAVEGVHYYSGELYSGDKEVLY